MLAYTLDRGTLAPIGRYDVDVEHPERLLSWLEPLLSPVPEVMPTPIAVALACGRYSLAFGRAHAQLQRLWSEVGDHPEVRLKRNLWDGLLRQVYGDDVGSDALFLQHTYPSAQIDMFYVFPPARLVSASVIPRTESTEQITGRAFQRWSRHRMPQALFEAISADMGAAPAEMKG